MPESTSERSEVAIVFALREELRPFLKECRIESQTFKKPAVLTRARFRGVPLLLCQTGFGMANAHEATELLLDHAKPSLILSVGCAGATQPDLQPGDVILADEIRSETPIDRFLTDDKAREELERLAREEGMSCQTGPLATLWNVAGWKAKAEMSQHGILALDMESAAVAAIAEKGGVPFASLRAIFDPMEEEIPASEPYDEARPLSFLIKNPRIIWKIPKYARWNRLCQKNLFRILSRFIDIHRH